MWGGICEVTIQRDYLGSELHVHIVNILLGLVLVDLKGFEPLTSSMPFKKYQSLTDIHH
jgi:hypothetical protein